MKSFIAILAMLLCVQAALSLTIISRAEWGAKTATAKTTLANNQPYAIIHHTAGNYCSTKAACITEIKSIQTYHMSSLGWSDIGYNFLVGGDGNVYEGRGWNVVGAHATNWNSKSIGISFMGNYSNTKPTAAQIAATKELLKMAVTKTQIKSAYILYGHRQVSATECPGNNLWAEITTWPNWTA